MTDVGIWPSQTVLPQLHRYHPITSQRNALLIGESQVGVGCWGSSFDFRLMESDCPSLRPGCGWIKFVFFNSSSGPKKEGTRDPWLSPLYCAARFFPLHSVSREQPLPPHYSASLALVSCSQLGQPLAEHQPFDLTLFATAGLSPKREQYALAIWPSRPRRPEQPRVLWGASVSGDCLPTSLARRVPCFCLFANQPFKIQIQATVSDSENHK